MRKMYLIVIVFLLNFSLNAQHIKVHLKQKLVIGADESSGEEYLFNDPRGICVDIKNNIYIADYNVNKVRIFTEDGKFIKYIGKTGQGPGEFQEICSITLDNNDNLIVTDRKNMRVTRFYNMGERFKCYHLNKYIEPRIIDKLNKDEYVFYYLHNNSYIPEKGDNLLHIFTKDFKLKESFAPVGEIYNFEEPFLVDISLLDHFASMIVADSTKIIFVPGFYDGILYMYNKINNKWILKKLQGKKFYKKPYKLLNPKRFDPRHHVPFTNYISGAGGIFYFKELCRNLGMVLLNDSTLAHFSRSVINEHGKNKPVTNIEIFNLKKGFTGYAGGCDIITIPQNKQLSISGVFCKDYNDDLYVSDCLINHIMAVRKFNLKYKLKEK